MAKANGNVTSEALARSIGTNAAVFRRTMAGLRRAGLVQSILGPGGGWRLGRPVETITLLEVYHALGEPSLFSFGNRDHEPDCKVQKSVNRALGSSMDRARMVLLEDFAAVTLDQLVP